MLFRPALHEHTVIPLNSHTAARSLHFTYSTPSPQDGPVPELWTSLPSGDWHAIPFGIVNFVNEAGRSYEAEIPLADAQPGAYEYTFRLQHPDGGLQWLGSEGSNGRLELVASDDVDEYEGAGPSFTGAETVKTGQRASLSSFELHDGVSDDIESFKLDLDSAEAGLNWRQSTGLVLERSE